MLYAEQDVLSVFKDSQSHVIKQPSQNYEFSSSEDENSYSFSESMSKIENT